MQIMPAKQPDRDGRHVRRSYLRLSSASQQSRAAFLLEESLRLAHLQGEDQGRVYYFRSVSLPQLSIDGSRGVWLSCVQDKLSTLSARAIHASDPRARFADAVFFDNVHQALTLMLHQFVRGAPLIEWFWPLVYSKGHEETGETKVIALIRQLRQEPASWILVAEVILSVLEGVSPALLLDSLPAATVQTWLRELDGSPGRKALANLVQTPSQQIAVVLSAVRHCGWNDSRSVWIAALAVIRNVGSDWKSVAAVSQAKSLLQMLASKETAGRRAEAAAPVPNAETAIPDAGSDDRNVRDISSSTSCEREQGTSDLLLKDRGYDLEKPGLPTNAAGFFFLLNGLRRLEIEKTLEECPALAEAQFVPHLLLFLARHASIEAHDPALLWSKDLDIEHKAFELTATLLANVCSKQAAWPANLRHVRPATPTPPALLRAWAVAVRRYCWRDSRISAGEMVHRRGWILQSRNDLDVTLPMETIDIRIRRAGLDIDPGWLPWFGRVVRFHYIETKLGV